MTKNSKQRASADVGLIFIVYNLKRIWNTLKANNKLFQPLYSIILALITILMSLLVPFLKSNIKNKILTPI